MGRRHATIINDIEKIRVKNNKLWMDLLRLAFKNSPEQAKTIFTQITDNDSEISKLSKELCSE